MNETPPSRDLIPTSDVDNSESDMDSGVSPPTSTAYTPEQRSLALAAVERYGMRGASTVLAGEWGKHVPHRDSFYDWRRDGVEVLEEHRQFWNDHDAQLKSRLKAAIEPHVYASLEAHQQAIDDGDSLAGQRWAISTGIFVDKLVPPSRAAQGAPLVGSAQSVQLLVISPAEIEGRRRDFEPEDDDVLEGEATDVE